VNEISDKYQMVSACESGDHYGVRIYVMLPPGVQVTDSIESEVQHAGYNLYDWLRGELFNNSPEEIAACDKEGRELLALFGDRKIFAEKIPNEYFRRECCNRPWFLVTTSKGHIKIGWRKSVMVIDWSKTTNEKSANELFPKEDVTKNGQMIHAWSYIDAARYLDVILA
jgi:hypothetical protein